MLVRDVDGKTFWDALDEAISPRIKSPTADDKSALSTFRGVFQGKPLKKETSIFLTWIDPNKMLVSMQFIYIILLKPRLYQLQASNVAFVFFLAFLVLICCSFLWKS